MIYDFIGTKKGLRIKQHPEKHICNRDEGKLLRKLMNETGLFEEEVRGIKKYRVMLSNAQKQSQERKRGRHEKWCHDRIKDACSITGLAPQHPNTIKALQEILNNYSSYKYSNWFGSRTKMTAEIMVKHYAK